MSQPQRARRRARRALNWLVGGLAAVAAALGVAFQTVPELILFRERVVLNILELESAVTLKPIDVTTRDGLVLRSWYHAPAPRKPVIVYFPGRAGDLVRKPAHLFQLAEQGYGLVLAGYRGYGGNPGRPSERRLYEDATDLLLRLGADGLAPDGIVLYGYSMGTGIASYLAARTQPRALVLEAPFTSFGAVVRNRTRSPVPLWMVRTKFDTGSRLADVHAPILLLAGAKDTVTPARFAEQLATVNAGFASLYVFPEATHDTLMEHGAWEALTEFLFGLVEESVEKLDGLLGP